MPIMKQQSSILTDQELQLLASPSYRPQASNFSVYTCQLPLELDNCCVYLSDTLEQLILMLSASSRGSALVLPDSIESPLLEQLFELLNRREDIQLFWVGKMPGMELNLPAFEYCLDKASLLSSLSSWQQRMAYVFKQWLETYRIAFIRDRQANKSNPQPQLEKMGVQKIEYFDGLSDFSDFNNKQLLIIDLSVKGLRFVDILNKLAGREQFPILLLFGKLPENLCRAIYTLAKNGGFPILACLPSVPDEQQWQQLLMSLFSKVYLKHWITKVPVKKWAYGIYNLENQHLESYFCVHGMSKKQIAALPDRKNVRKIVSASSLVDWFPDSIRREIRNELATTLNCNFNQIDICIEHADKIQTTSVLFAALVMARLAHFRIYWFVHNELQLSTDLLKHFPISDLIFSEPLSYQLLGTPSDELLSFIEQAKIQGIRLGATLQQNQATNYALSLYGIEFVLNKHEHIK